MRATSSPVSPSSLVTLSVAVSEQSGTIVTFFPVIRTFFGVTPSQSVPGVNRHSYDRIGLRRVVDFDPSSVTALARCTVCGPPALAIGSLATRPRMTFHDPVPRWLTPALKMPPEPPSRKLSLSVPPARRMMSSVTSLLSRATRKEAELSSICVVPSDAAAKHSETLDPWPGAVCTWTLARPPLIVTLTLTDTFTLLQVGPGTGRPGESQPLTLL